MSLAQNSTATSADFNTWLSDSITEFQRRNKAATTVGWPAQTPEVTQNTKIEILTAAITNTDSDYITGNNIYQYILTKYKKINSDNFPTDYDIATNTLIKTLSELDGYLTIYKNAPDTGTTVSDSQCKAGCTGLCLATCSTVCSEDCTSSCYGSTCVANSCSADSCKGETCRTSCLNNCASGCSSSNPCGGSCTTSCATSCATGCTSSNPCGGSCSTACATACSSGCSSGNACTAACASTCGNAGKCATGCTPANPCGGAQRS